MVTSNTQFAVRVPVDVIKGFKERCNTLGYPYAEMTRILLREFAHERLNLQWEIRPPTPPRNTPELSLGEMLK